MRNAQQSEIDQRQRLPPLSPVRLHSDHLEDFKMTLGIHSSCLSKMDATSEQVTPNDGHLQAASRRDGNTRVIYPRCPGDRFIVYYTRHRRPAPFERVIVASSLQRYHFSLHRNHVSMAVKQLDARFRASACRKRDPRDAGASFPRARVQTCDIWNACAAQNRSQTYSSKTTIVPR